MKPLPRIKTQFGSWCRMRKHLPSKLFITLENVKIESIVTYHSINKLGWLPYDRKDLLVPIHLSHLVVVTGLIIFETLLDERSVAERFNDGK